MKKQNRKAFTIVELVIVIAVIGILAAVLIPTFSGIIKSANIAADQAAAASMTTELQLAAGPEGIHSEGELIKAINKIDPNGTKFAPKSAQYGYHFWFDMKTQSIQVKKATGNDGVESVDRANIARGNTEPSSVMAIADNTPTTEDVTTSFRDIYDNDFYFIDAIGSGHVAHALYLIDTLNRDSDYKNLIETVIPNALAVEEDAPMAQIIYNKLLTTTIHTRSGSYFCDNSSTKEYFSASTNTIGGKYYNYNTQSRAVESATAIPVPTVAAGNTPLVVVPDHLTYVVSNALDYATAKSVILSLSTTDYAASIFSRASTNALIKLGDEDILQVIGTINGGTVDVIKGKDVTNDTDYTAILSGELPFDNFLIGTPDTENVSINNDKIYVASKNGTLQLYAVNAENENETSGRINNWIVSDTTKGSFSIDSQTGVIDLTTCEFVPFTMEDGTELKVCEVVVKATAEFAEKDDVIRERTIVVAMPVAATVSFYTSPYNSTKQTISTSAEKNEITLKYTGDLYSYGIETLPQVTYTTDIDNKDAYAIATGAPVNPENVKISIAENEIFKYDSINGRIIMDSPDLVNGGKYTFTMLFDSCLPTEVSVTAEDASTVVVDPNYNHNSTTERPYYVGSENAINFSEIFKINNLFVDGVTATVNVYDAVGNSGKLYPLYLTNTSPGNLSMKVATISVDANGNKTVSDPQSCHSFEINKGNIDKFLLSFEFAKTDAESNDIYIEIIPTQPVATVAEGDENATKLNTLVLKFTVVNGAKNVFESDIADEYNEDGTVKTKVNDIDVVDAIFNPGVDSNNQPIAGKDVVLYTDLTAETGDYLNIGDHTLYGNGFVIDAKTYEANKTGNIHEQWIPWCSEWQIPADQCTDTGSWHGLKHLESKKFTYYDYYTDVALISLGENGKIDNIYIDGPIYPHLQYLADDCTDSNHASASYAYTGYHTSGIKVSGSATITNSYILGFRQPVKMDDDGAGKTLSITNTTLRGGNYANLQLASGNLVLTDVTTIQDQNGIENTFGVIENVNNSNNLKRVTGVGIVIEDDAVTLDANNKVISAPTITIDGYLNQYNWVEKNQTAVLPTVSTSFGKSIDMNSVMGWMFDGVLSMKMSRFWFYIHQVECETLIEDSEDYDSSVKQYINASIMFIDVPEVSGGNIARYSATLDGGTVYANIIQAQAGNGYKGYTGRTYEKTGIQLTAEEQRLGMSGALTFFTGTDITVVFYSFTDGQDWTNKKDNDGNAIRGQIAVATPGKTPIYVTDSDLNYNGYYTLGNYAALYN